MIDELKAENEALKQELEKIKSLATSGDDEKESPQKKTKNKKYNLNKIEDQIEVLSSSTLRSESLYLVCKPQYIPKSNNEYKNFSFLKFLETSLNDKVVEQLYSKIKSDTVDGKQLLALLTLAVLIYKVKLHRMKTGSTERPKMDSTEFRHSVKHLSAWIIRRYGQKSENEKKYVTIKNDLGEVIDGEYSIYTFSENKDTFSEDFKEWVFDYIEQDGNIELI